jgi:hypothetical protein
MNSNGPRVVRGPPVLHAWLSSYRVVICARTDGPGDLNGLFGRDAYTLERFYEESPPTESLNDKQIKI